MYNRKSLAICGPTEHHGHRPGRIHFGTPKLWGKIDETFCNVVVAVVMFCQPWSLDRLRSKSPPRRSQEMQRTIPRCHESREIITRQRSQTRRERSKKRTRPLSQSCTEKVVRIRENSFQDRRIFPSFPVLITIEH